MSHNEEVPMPDSMKPTPEQDARERQRQAEEAERPGGRAFFIELKAGKAGRVSQAQADCHQALLACGCLVAICRSLADVAQACEAWSISLRAGLSA